MRGIFHLIGPNQKIQVLFSILILQLVTPNNSNSQDYMPFPQNNAVWYSVYSYPWPHEPFIYYRTYKYEAKGDTIINSIEYTKFYSCDAFDEDTCLNYRGAYRVNIDSARVYYLDNWEAEERLVYDFLLNPGDSIISGGTSFICLDTGLMVMSDGSTQKYQTMLVPVANDCIQTWVTGLGSLGLPLLEPYWGCGYTFESSYNLTCYFYNDEQVYYWFENPFFEECVGTNENIGIDENRVEYSLSVFPNPVISISKINCTYAVNELYDFQILNANGIVVQSESGIMLQSISIDKNDFSPGIHIIQLYSYSENQLYTIKFMVM